MRAIPHPGLYVLPTSPGAEPASPSLPFEVWEKMTPHGQHICRNIVAAKGTQVPAVDWSPDWEGAEGGGGWANARHKGTEISRL